MDTYFRHDLNLAIGKVFGFEAFWYGAVYSIGFLGLFGWLWLRREGLGLTKRDVVDLCIWVALGVLFGGRVFDILVYELGYYRTHPIDALNWWKGGLASHGVLLGGSIATILFCYFRNIPFLKLADEIVVPAAFLFAVGRIGNFIEGGVIGIPTSVPWAVIYPDIDAPRHPVALYESAKNFVVMFVLIFVLRKYPAGRGVTMSTFIFLYAFLRFLVDMFRDYEANWLGLDTGQIFNLIMAAAGLLLIVHFLRHPQAASAGANTPSRRDLPVGWLRIGFFAFLLIFPLGIPTSWTLDNIVQKRAETMENAVPD